MVRDPFDHVRQIEQGEDVTLYVHVPRHIGANQTELARSPQQSTQAPTADEHHRGSCIMLTCNRSVPTPDPDRQRSANRRLRIESTSGAAPEDRGLLVWDSRPRAALLDMN